MKILFFGSSDFSLPIARNIHGQFKIVGVVISEPKPKGRGLKHSLPEIARWAESESIKVYMPSDPNAEVFVDEIRQLGPDLYVLSAYGHILCKELLEIPSLGGINVHPSLLPQYRGAAPIQRAIMAGEKKTGVTLFFMDEKIDHGKMIMQRSVQIEGEDTYGSLSTKLSGLGAEMIIDTLRRIASGDCRSVPQDGAVSHAPKLKKCEVLIDWTEGAAAINNRIRALSPHPGARTYFRGKELMILQARVGDKRLSPGALLIEDRKLHVGTASGSLVLLAVKPEGKKTISVRDFINGYRIQKGEVLG
ncbi:MAG: methionyl-tRNA formyltransferase [candidate division WOR-3 bacterium]|nr:MAG: methionyl-tRNA formyltransferase [candidate division WOR-3 bacterium]